MIGQCRVHTRPLAEILDEHLPAGTIIDFLSVDAEGYDEEVLRSNNWQKYRPRLILAEDTRAFTFDQVIDSQLAKYMKEIGYVPISKLVHTVVYCEATRVRGASDVLVA